MRRFLTLLIIIHTIILLIPLMKLIFPSMYPPFGWSDFFSNTIHESPEVVFPETKSYNHSDFDLTYLSGTNRWWRELELRVDLWTNHDHLSTPLLPFKPLISVYLPLLPLEIQPIAEYFVIQASKHVIVLPNLSYAQYTIVGVLFSMLDPSVQHELTSHWLKDM